MKIVVFLSLFAICLPVNLFSDYGTVFLKNGNEIEGNVQKEKNGSLTVSTGYAIIKFERGEVKRVHYGVPAGKPTATLQKSTQSTVTPAKVVAKHANIDNKMDKYDDLICSAADKHGLDPQLIKAVMKAESGFNKNDVSNKGACGLMQLMPDTAKLLGVKDIFSPKENVDAGTKFLKDMLYQFDGDLELALAAYNAGPEKVKKYKNVPPYKETKNYIKTVYKNYTNNYRPNRIYTYCDEKGCLNIYNVK
jgi:hypothetical protein